MINIEQAIATLSAWQRYRRDRTIETSNGGAGCVAKAIQDGRVIVEADGMLMSLALIRLAEELL